LNIKVYPTAVALQQQLHADRSAGLKIGFVPTMGALHEGHLSLIRKALRENDCVVCSIFVNPTQFNDPKDLQKYPRMPEQDFNMLESAGCQYVFYPSVEEMYPQGARSKHYDLGRMEEVMEGAFRAGHFQGVATVVDQLFSLVQPDNSYFGEKDYQQLAIIRKMVALTGHSTSIIGCPTLRENDGLAMSSRNLLLTEAERKAAPLIYQGLTKAQHFIPHHSVAAVKDLITRFIEQSPLLNVQYLEFVDTHTLEPVSEWPAGADVQGCIAVLTSGPRLIDNLKYSVNN
jgi:pantoate--beta-alanine ligase